jgi:Tol biopolymer transport system component
MLRLSPDGRRVALVAGSLNAGNAVWVVDENGLASRVTSQPTVFNSPVWSADGRTMVVTIRSPDSREREMTGCVRSRLNRRSRPRIGERDMRKGNRPSLRVRHGPRE